MWRSIREYVIPGAFGVDAGAGLGDWVHFMNSRGSRTYGIDYSEALSRRCKTLWLYEWIVSDIQAMPFRSSSLDFIYSWGVIEHMPEGPKKVLSEFRRVLKRNGVVAVTVPLDSPASRRSSEYQFPSATAGAVFFQYLMTREDLECCLREAGFAVVALRRVDRQPLALCFPRLYVRTARSSRAVRLAAKMMASFFGWGRDTYGMLLGVGKKMGSDSGIQGTAKALAPSREERWR